VRREKRGARDGTAIYGAADDSAEQLQIDQTMGACYYIQRKYDDALREFARRQNALIAANRTKSVEFASSWVDVGDVQLDRKDPVAAAESYGKAVKAYEEMLGMTDVRLALPLWRIGEAQLRANHPERAIEPLERAVKIYEASHSPAITAADAWSRLAKALWTKPAERARARELATKARDGYLTATVARAKDRAAEMDAWLKAHN
jgi:tetratricopeptide (TPR) repeat protein